MVLIIWDQSQRKRVAEVKVAVTAKAEVKENLPAKVEVDLARKEVKEFHSIKVPKRQIKFQEELKLYKQLSQKDKDLLIQEKVNPELLQEDHMVWLQEVNLKGNQSLKKLKSIDFKNFKILFLNFLFSF